jgi:hypothetical protein
MKTFNFTRICRRAWLAPQTAMANVRFLWNHGPITRETADRIDRLSNSKKYLSQVNPPEVL